jgi:hypothetical protein
VQDARAGLAGHRERSLRHECRRILVGTLRPTRCRKQQVARTVADGP